MKGGYNVKVCTKSIDQKYIKFNFISTTATTTALLGVTMNANYPKSKMVADTGPFIAEQAVQQSRQEMK